MQVRSAVLAALCYGSAVAWLPPGAIGRAARHGTNAVQMAALSPGDNVFVLGRGPVMLLSAKIAANAGYKTSIIDGPNMADFLGEVPSNLELIAPGDVDRLSGALAEAAGMIFATDDSAAMTEDTLDLVLPPSGGSARAVKRVVGMSRNAVTTTEEGGGSGMGFFTAMAKKAANNQIWDAAPKECAAFRTFEASIRRRAEAYGASATVMRAGTLKGGGPGDPAEGVGPSEKACLSPAYYTMMPGQDLVNWQLLFDCRTNGVQLFKGDTAPGAGLRGVFTSISERAEPGDTGRGGVAAAMVQALAQPAAEGGDFAVGTADGKAEPTQTEWDSLFRAVV